MDTDQLKEASVKEAKTTPPTTGISVAIAIPDGCCTHKHRYSLINNKEAMEKIKDGVKGK